MSTTISDASRTAEKAHAALARSVNPRALLRAIRSLGITHVVTVPDTHQRSLLALLAESHDPRLLTVCTEDEAIGISAGLYIGGAKPMLLIQNNGLYACLNTLKAIPLDARVPVFMLIGEHGRDLSVPSRDSAERSVRMLEPTLELWDVPCYRLDGPEDLRNIERGYRHCQERGGAVAILVGAPTARVEQSP